MSDEQPVIVVATAYPKEEARQQAAAAFAEAVEQVHAEPGCQLYALHEGTDRLVMIEKWDSPAALDTHSKAPALQQLTGKLDGLLSAPLDIQVLRPHPAGDAARGAL